MERIVIEVDERLARAWRSASDKKRKDIGNKFNLSLSRELMKQDDGEKDDKTDDYLCFLNELRNDMTNKGLTFNELDIILNDD